MQVAEMRHTRMTLTLNTWVKVASRQPRRKSFFAMAAPGQVAVNVQLSLDPSGTNPIGFCVQAGGWPAGYIAVPLPVGVGHVYMASQSANADVVICEEVYVDE